MQIYFDDLRQILFERELGLKQSTNHILRMTRSILQNAYLKSEQIKIFNIFCISQDAKLAAPPLMAVWRCEPVYIFVLCFIVKLSSLVMISNYNGSHLQCPGQSRHCRNPVNVLPAVSHNYHFSSCLGSQICGNIQSVASGKKDNNSTIFYSSKKCFLRYVGKSNSQPLEVNTKVTNKSLAQVTASSWLLSELQRICWGSLRSSLAPPRPAVLCISHPETQTYHHDDS